jgi:hypothetical protein
MSTPALLLGFLISTLYGALFHLWRGGSPGRLLFYLALSWVGFSAGQITANILGWSFDNLGQLHLLTASVGSILFLGIGYWLSLIDIQRK